MSGSEIVTALSPHESTPAPWVRSLDVRLRWTSRALALSYRLSADLALLRLPSEAVIGRLDGLWRHTCFEAFVASDAGGYVELNFAPGGAWAAYAFTGYRQAMAPATLAADPLIRIQREEHPLAPGVLQVDVEVVLPSLCAGSRGRLGLAAVLEDSSGTLSYWAARHPPGRPDFHHPDGFVLERHP